MDVPSADPQPRSDEENDLAPAPPAIVAVRTYRRPLAPARLLGLALSMQRNGARLRPWLVIDDARDAANAAPTLDVLVVAAREGLWVMDLGQRSAKRHCPHCLSR